MEGSKRRLRFGAVLASVVLVVIVLLAYGGVALAATPQEIYDDFAKDGDLDGSYTDDEIAAVFTDPTIAQYGDPDVLNKLKAYTSTTTRETFPFTGAQMIMIIGGGIALVALGVFLRRGRRPNEGS